MTFKTLCSLSLPLLFGWTATSCQAPETHPDAETATFVQSTLKGAPEIEHPYDPRTVLVRFRDVPTISSTAKVLAAVHGTIEDQNDDGRFDHFSHIAQGRLALVELDGTVSVRDALTILQSEPSIAYAEPNYIVRAFATPNDTRYPDLWGMNNTGQTGGTPDADIDAPEAWDISTGDSSIVVGVIDTGIDYNHPDLVENMWFNPGEIAGNGIDDDGNGYVDDIHGINAINNTGDPMDTNDHGTHCSGTIGGRGNNSQGVVGVNWEVSLVGCKFLGNQGGTTADGIKCIDYMVDLRVNRNINLRILSNSWGGGGFSQALQDAIVASHDADMLFVAAAGNDGRNNDVFANYPSNYEVPNVFAVASTTHTDGTSGFSNYGATTVDIGAPGSGIVSTTIGGTYSNFSGTSMATPHVAGVAALVLSVNPALTNVEIMNLIMASGDPVGGNWVSGNRLNAEQALLDANPLPTFRLTTTPASRAINQGDQTTFDVTVTALNGFVGNVNLSVSSSLPQAPTFSVNPVTATGMSVLSVTTDVNTSPGDYTLSIEATDGTISRRSSVVLSVRPQGTVVQTYESTDTPISLPDNDPVGVTSVINVPDSLIIEEIDIPVDITHTWIGDLIIEVTSPAGTTVRLHDRAGGSADDINRTYNLPTEFDQEDAQGNWTLWVSDNAGQDLGTINAWSVIVTGAPPVVNTPPVADFSFTTRLRRARFTDQSTDADGTVVAWAWDFGDGRTSSRPNPRHTYRQTGTYAVTLTVTDDAGDSHSITQNVTVTSPVPNIVLGVVDTQMHINDGRVVNLSYSGGSPGMMDIFRDGRWLAAASHTGVYQDRFKSNGTQFNYQICEAGTNRCSNLATANMNSALPEY